MGLVSVNGKTYTVPDGAAFEITNDTVLVDGKPIESGVTEPTINLVVIEGKIGSIKTIRANVQCGDVEGSVNAGGSITCGNVKSSVDAGGSVTCGDVGGDVDAGGSVKCENVSGDVDAGGSVRRK